MEQQAFWDKQETVGEIMRGKYNTIVVSRCEKNGNKYVDIRNWYIPRGESEWRPGKGISIPFPAVKDVMRYIEECVKDGVD